MATNVLASNASIVPINFMGENTKWAYYGTYQRGERSRLVTN
jgi:hypothetical protein